MSKISPTYLSYSDYKKLCKNGLPITYGVPLYLASRAGTEYTLNVLNVSSAQASNNQQIVLWQLPQGPRKWNMIFAITPEGYIVCPYFPWMALGIAAGVLCILTRDENDATQKWTFTRYQNAYTITNQDQNLAITAASQPNGSIAGNVTLQPLDATPSDSQLWMPLPGGDVALNRFYLQTKISGKPGTGNNPYVATLNNGQASVEVWEPGNQYQLWVIQPDGKISTASDFESILISNSKSNTDTTPVTVAPASSAASPLYYTWSYSENFISVDLGGDIGVIGLNVKGNDTPGEIITYENSSKDGCYWYVFPEQGLTTGEWIYLKASASSGAIAVLTAQVNGEATGAALQLSDIQYGNPTQLWHINTNGHLVSALSPGLVLSVSTSSGNPISLQQIGTEGFLQTWCYAPNGVLVTCLNQSELLYLTAESLPANGNPGTVGLYTNQNDNPKVIWDTVAYEPDTSGQFFTINSALSSASDFQSFLLTVEPDWGRIGIQAPMGGNVLREGAPSVNQLWRYTLNGNIISAANPYLALTYNPGSQSIVLAVIQPGNVYQQWYWGETSAITFKVGKKNKNFNGGTLLNRGAMGLALNAAGVPSSSSCSPAVALADITDVPNQVWYMLPHEVNYDQSTTIRNLGGQGNVPGLFISLQQQSLSRYSLSVGSQGADPSYNIWKFIEPGFIVSQADPQIVLSLEPSENPADVAFGPAVCAALRDPDAPAWQLWTATAEGLLINHFNGLALCAVSPENGASLSTSQPDYSDNNNPETLLQVWEFGAGKALQTALIQPNVDFPGTQQADPAEQAYYQQISGYLGLPLGLRSQYMNLSAPLSAYQAEMNAYVFQQTGGNPGGDWLATLQQLNREITAVMAVQQFFRQAGIFHQAISLAQSMVLSEVITACEIGENATVTPRKEKNRSWIWDFTEGLIYTGLNLGGLVVADPELGSQAKGMIGIFKDGCPVFANLMATTFTAGQAGLEGASNNKSQNLAYNRMQEAIQRITSYEITVLQLQETLLKTFEASGSALAQIESLVLDDWGKITAVYNMIKMPGGMDSLYWPPALSPQMAKSLLSSYGITVLQTLMPNNTKYQISGNPFCSYNPQGYGSLRLSLDGTSLTTENLDGSASNWNTVNIPPQVLNLIWGFDTNPINFFRRRQGWDVLPMIYPNLVSQGAGTNQSHSAGVVVTVQNFTGYQFTIDLSGLQTGVGSALAGNPAQSRSLEPFGLTEFAAYSWIASPDHTPEDYGAYGNFSITNISGTADAVAVACSLGSNARNGIDGPIVYNVEVTPTPPFKVYCKSKYSYGLSEIKIDIYV